MCVFTEHDNHDNNITVSRKVTNIILDKFNKRTTQQYNSFSKGENLVNSDG